MTTAEVISKSTKRYSTTEVLFVIGICVLVTACIATATMSHLGSRTTTVDRFHTEYYKSAVWTETRWMGAQVLKNPLDMWVFQEILYESKPDVLIETGTFRGGSALFFATIMDLVGKGRIYTIDIEKKAELPKHPRIGFYTGSSTDDQTLAWLRSQIKPGERVMVTLDSLHTKQHVLAELDRYAPLVSPGMYLIVEDSNIGHPVFDPSPELRAGGPWEALDEWLPEHPEFQRDRAREKFGMTFNPGGWLRKLEPSGLKPPN